MNYNNINTITFASQAYSGAGHVLEVRLPNTATYWADILRMWIGAAEGTDPVDEIQEVAIFRQSIASTGGSSVTAEANRVGDSALGFGLRGGTTAGSREDVHYDAFNLNIGWLYLPVPEERFRWSSEGTFEVMGFRFPVAPDASITISAGITYGIF